MKRGMARALELWLASALCAGTLIWAQDRDFLTPDEAEQIRAALPKIPIEASGNMNLKTVRKYALAGVDFVSVGALTHSAAAADLSMRITADIY